MINENIKLVGLVKVLDGSDDFITVDIEITNPVLIDRIHQGLIDTLSLRAKLNPSRSTFIQSRSKNLRKPFDFRQHLRDLSEPHHLGSTFKPFSETEQQIIEDIHNGLPVTSNKDKKRSNDLTRLRRNHIIKNEGTRARPKWRLVKSEADYYS